MQHSVPWQDSGGHLQSLQFIPVLHFWELKQEDLSPQQSLDVQQPFISQQPDEGLHDPLGHLQLVAQLQTYVDSIYIWYELLETLDKTRFR